MKQIRLEVSNEAFAVLTEMARRGRVQPEAIARICVEDRLAQAIDKRICEKMEEIIIEAARDQHKECVASWNEARENPGTYGIILEQAAKKTTPRPAKGELKVKLKNGFDLYRVDSKCRKTCGPVAKKFGLTVERFLAKLSRHTLPGQLPQGSRFEEEVTSPPEGFRISLGHDEGLCQRVVRAAQFTEQSVDEFVWKTLAGSVSLYEEDMILDPKDFLNPIGDELEIESFRIAYERRCCPIGS